MELGLANRVALVTAASRGLGYASAMALAQEGARVAICSRSKTRIHAAASRIAKTTGSTVIGIHADLTKQQHLRRLACHVENALGPIEIFVSNTGNPPAGPFAVTNDKDWELGASLCLRPPIVLCRHILPGMKKRKFGRIIFLSSIFSREPDSGFVVSSTMRAALAALAKCISREVAKDGICVNHVCPGYFDTPLLRELARGHARRAGTTGAKVLTDWANLAPAGKLGAPSDLGTIVAWLASPHAEYLQGVTLPIDGGALHGI